MNSRTIGAIVALGCAALLSLPAAPLVMRAEEPTLGARLGTLRTAANLPALAGATFRSTGAPDIAAVGVRRVGDATPVTTADLWHIGSLTKSFTATLTAVFIERGQLSWTSTVEDLLGPNWARHFGAVTVRDLMTHRAGLPPNVPPVFMLMRLSPLPVVEQRKRVLDSLLSREPASKPGEKFTYSNAGYIALGAILEARAGKPWEELLRSEVLKPLRLDTAGFGPPGTAGAVTQPRGHRVQEGTLTPVEPGPDADNPAFLGPAGTLHMSISDIVRWGQAHLSGERGQDGLVRAATFQKLHDPPTGGDYACGWVIQRDGARRVIWHNGSNTMWYVILAFDPEADRGVVLATNGGIAAAKPLNDAAMGLLKDLATSKQ